MIVLLWDACSTRNTHKLVSILTIYCTIATVLLYPALALGKSEQIRISTQERSKVTEEQLTSKSFGDDDHENEEDGFHMYDELTHTESLAVVEDSINVFAKDVSVAFSDLLDSDDDSKHFVEQVNDFMDDDHHRDVDHNHDNSKHPSETFNRTNSLHIDHDHSNYDHNHHSAHDHSNHDHHAHDHIHEDHVDHDHKDHHHDDDHKATEIDNDEHIHSKPEEHAMLVEDTEDEGFLEQMEMDPEFVKKQYFGWLRRNEDIDIHDYSSNDHTQSHDEHEHNHDEHDHSHGEPDYNHDEHDHNHDEHDHNHDEHDHNHDEHDHSHDEHDHNHDDHTPIDENHDHNHVDHDVSHDEHDHSYDDLYHSLEEHNYSHNDHDHSQDHYQGHDEHDHGGHEGHSHAAKGRVLSDISGSTWLVACASVLVISLVGVISVAFLPLLSNERGEAVLQAFICVAVGTLVGDSFIHLAPHALTHSHSPETTWKGFLASMVVMAFITLDKLLSFMGVKHGHSHVTVFEPIIKNDQDQDKMTTDDSFSQASTMMTEECGSLSNDSILQLHETVSGTGKHPHKHKVSNTNLMVIIGDAIHNFADGIAIGAAFSIGYGPGLSTSIAVLCHELPHEIGDFAILIQNGMTIKRALFYNLVSSVTGFLGMCLGMVMGSNGDYSSWLIAGIMGVFLYVALVSMLPEIKANSKFQMACNIGGMILGVLLLLVIGLYEEDLIYLFAV